MEMSQQELEAEAARVTDMLRGKVVAHVFRHRTMEVMVQFTDGTRLFVDSSGGSVELSVT
jgi:hypothetical protein